MEFKREYINFLIHKTKSFINSRSITPKHGVEHYLRSNVSADFTKTPLLVLDYW